MKSNEETIDENVKKFNVLSLISFICSIIGLVVAGLPCGIIAMITGIIGLVKFKEETEKGRWMAITGLIVGVLEIIFMVMYLMTIAVGSGA